MQCSSADTKFNSMGDVTVIPGKTTGLDFDTVLKTSSCETGEPLTVDPADHVAFSAKETKDAVSFYVDHAPVTVVDGTIGSVHLSLTSSDLPYAGIWWAAFQVIDPDGKVVSETPAWLMVEKSIDHAVRENTPLCPSELRLFMMDVCPENNPLLDDVEFTTEEYMAVIRWVVDKWNETPPDVARYTQTTFPWRYHWMVGAASRLLMMASRWNSRNHLSFSTGDATVDDRDNAKEYAALARELEQEFLIWFEAKKVEINQNLCYGSLTAWEFQGRR